MLGRRRHDASNRHASHEILVDIGQATAAPCARDARLHKLAAAA